MVWWQTGKKPLKKKASIDLFVDQIAGFAPYGRKTNRTLTLFGFMGLCNLLIVPLGRSHYVR